MKNKIINFLAVFFDLGLIKQFYYPLRYNKLKLRLLKSRFKHLGKGSYIDFPVRIRGKDNVYIGDDVVINSFVHMWGQGGIYIGNRVMIASHTSITSLTHDYTLHNMSSAPAIRSKVTIEDDVWIGSHVVIMPGITIGQGAVIGAGSIVTKDVKAGVIAFGNPAREIKKRFENE